MEEFLEDMRLVLGTLGYPILEPLLQPAATYPGKSATLETASLPDDELTFTVHNFVAKGVQTDEGFVLKRGSTASKTNPDSLNIKLVKLKEQLLADGRLVVEAENLRLIEDLLMSSRSYAAALIAGTARCGPQSWYANNGRSLKEIEDFALESFRSPL